MFDIDVLSLSRWKYQSQIIGQFWRIWHRWVWM